MQTDIVNFLPKYPTIYKLDEEVLNPYSKDFYEVIYKKKEFYDEKLEIVETFPTEVGTLLKHQKIISRFFSSKTSYNSLLLFHVMGTGKTCSTIGAIENIRKEKNNFKGAYVFARGGGLLNNFVNELLFKCTDGRYIPENFENLTELEKSHRIKKSVEKYYKLNTFETFAKKISKMSNTNIKEQFSNHIIVIDEVHNLRIQDGKIKNGMYEQFWRFLHNVENYKILLLTGTPMKTYS